MPRRLLLALDAVLIAVAGMLGVHLYRVWTTAPVTQSVRPAATATDAPPTPTAAPAPARPAFSTFAVVAERNLFSPTRTETPPEPPRTAAAPAVPPAPKPRLYGVVLLPDGKSRAYLEDVQRRRVSGYGLGDAIADSRVEQIKPDRVVLRRGSEVFEVLLRDPTKPKPAPTPATRSQAPLLPPSGRPTPGQSPVTPGVPPSADVPTAPGTGPTVAPVPPAGPGRPSVPRAPGRTQVPGPTRPDSQDPDEDDGS